MPKFIENRIVRFTSAAKTDGTPMDDLCGIPAGMAGLLSIYESENLHPGKKFFYFYPNEPEAAFQKYVHSGCGEMIEDGDVLVFETDNRYTFECGDFVSQDDAELLWLNVFFR